MGFIDRSVRPFLDFRVDCPCGKRTTVTEGDAGAMLQCSCGRAFQVPALHQLRSQTGLTPHALSPEVVIERLLLAGRLPPTRACAGCGEQTDEALKVVVECERSWVRQTGGVSWAALFLGLLPFILVHIFYRERPETKEFGKDKIYSLPLPVCLGCRPPLCDGMSIKHALRKVPDYARLLDKFPDAKVTA